MVKKGTNLRTINNPFTTRFSFSNRYFENMRIDNRSHILTFSLSLESENENVLGMIS